GVGVVGVWQFCRREECGHSAGVKAAGKVNGDRQCRRTKRLDIFSRSFQELGGGDCHIASLKVAPAGKIGSDIVDGASLKVIDFLKEVFAAVSGLGVDELQNFLPPNRQRRQRLSQRQKRGGDKKIVASFCQVNMVHTGFVAYQIEPLILIDDK